MRLLVIDTTTAACSVALLNGSDVIAARHEIVGRGHAERLIPMIGALPDHGCADAIRVGCGPGSFTGIRVGIAAARALGLGWDVPVAGFPSLMVLAAAALNGDAARPSVGVAMNGGHGEYFVQRFGAGPVHGLSDVESLTLEAAASVLSDPLVVGSAAAALVALRGNGIARDALPCAADFRFLDGIATLSAPTPIYGRAPDARVAA